MAFKNKTKPTTLNLASINEDEFTRITESVSLDFESLMGHALYVYLEAPKNAYFQENQNFYIDFIETITYSKGLLTDDYFDLVAKKEEEIEKEAKQIKDLKHREDFKQSQINNYRLGLILKSVWDKQGVKNLHVQI